MTDRSDERPDEGQPPADVPPAGASPPPGGTPPGSGQPPAGGQPPAPEPPPTGGQPPAPEPPPTPTPPSQAQWPQQQSGGASSDQRNWAVGAHLGALAASVVTGLAVLGPLLVYLIKKDEDPFVREHAREALNFQLTWLIGGIVGTIAAVIITIVTVGFGAIVFVPAAFGFFVAWVVFMIKAALAASRGEYYRYPLTVRMVT